MNRNEPARRAGWIGAGLLVAIFAGLMLMRGIVLWRITQGTADCSVCMGATAIQQDAVLLALLLALTGLSLLVRQYALQLLLLLPSAVVVIAYGADIVLLHTLTSHLYLYDIIKFRNELAGITQFIVIFLATPSGKLVLIAAVIAVVVLILALLPRPRRPRAALVCLVCAAAAGATGAWQPATMHYIRYEMLQNLLAANLELGINRPYSEAFKKTLLAEPQPAPACAPAQAQHPNLIIVAVESLSTHHSKLFGGIRDLTPRLDAIARSHTWFPDFIANGFATDGGLISMITGRLPVMGRYQSAESFAGFSDPHGALPDLVHAAGYTAHFFTTGDLAFENKAPWLQRLQFDTIEGAEAAYYSGSKRRHFNAAEDKALYGRFLQWLDLRDPTASPYLAFLLTVSTHPPFIDPRSDTPDEAGAFRYADEQIGVLYDELEKRGFFKNGILLIAGDHRSMTPLTAEEQRRFGESAMARTPLVIATDLPIPRGEVKVMFAQTDIAPSVADLVCTQACRLPGQGAFLRAEPVPPAYALHVRGDKRDAIDVLFDGQHGEIILDGDHSHWTGDRPSQWRQIMNGVLLDRIKRSANNGD